jgi:DNA/RNA endonuclease YhcR with UshA esterase domain
LVCGTCQIETCLKGPSAYFSVMKPKYVLVAALSLAAVIGFAQETKKAEAPKKIGALEATNYYNKTMIVTGKVAQVSLRPTINFINLDEKYPKSPFAAIVFPSATNQFPDLKGLQGKNVELKGKITERQGKPQMILNSSNQVTIVEQKEESK